MPYYVYLFQAWELSTADIFMSVLNCTFQIRFQLDLS